MKKAMVLVFSLAVLLLMGCEDVFYSGGGSTTYSGGGGGGGGPDCYSYSFLIYYEGGGGYYSANATSLDRARSKAFAKAFSEGKSVITRPDDAKWINNGKVVGYCD